MPGQAMCHNFQLKRHTNFKLGRSMQHMECHKDNITEGQRSRSQGQTISVRLCMTMGLITSARNVTEGSNLVHKLSSCTKEVNCEL